MKVRIFAIVVHFGWALLAAVDFENVVDLKPYANCVYGVRRAEKVDDSTIRVVLGATATGAIRDKEAWRIVSERDPAYAYEKFVRPLAVKSFSTKSEFAYPKGRAMHVKGSIPLNRTEVELTLPSPMIKDADYSVVAYGSGQSCITAALTGMKVGEGKGDEWATRIIGLRQVSSVGGGVLLCEFGAGYSDKGGDLAANWKVTVNGQACPVKAIGRRTKLDFYKTEGWPYGGVLLTDAFLDLGVVLKDGDKVVVTVTDAVTCGEKSAVMTFDAKNSVSRSLQANQVGYRVDGAKIAYLGCWFGSMSHSLQFESAPDFALVDKKSGKTVFSGKAKLTHRAKEVAKVDAGSDVWELDFTSVTGAGEYYLSVPGVGRSIAFTIGDSIYVKAFNVQAQGIYCQRCGCELDPKLTGGWKRIACHADGIVPTTVKRYLSQEWGDFVHNTLPGKLKAKGGHHDAGDYNPRSHLEVAQRLMELLELRPGACKDGELNVPEHGNGIPDVMDEAIWQLRLWVGLQDKDGGVPYGTESQGDPHFFQTVEMDDKGDYAWAKDSKASYLVSGAFAQASRLLAGCGKQKAAAEFLTRAKSAYEWAEKNPPSDLKDPAALNDYTIASRAYAAASLYHTTKETKYHEEFRKLCPWTTNPRAEITVWKKYDMQDAARQYLLLPKTLRDEKLWADILNAVKAEYTMFVNGNAKNPYKFLKNPWAPVVWGSGAYENYAVNAGFFYALTGDKTCRDWLIRTCDNTLGANPLGLSWITGLGERTIRCPLHNCRYRSNGLPVAGLQGQGPNQNAAGYSVPETTYPRPEAAKANLHTFVDTHFAIAMDEPTVNNMVNSLFIFGLLR